MENNLWNHLILGSKTLRNTVVNHAMEEWFQKMKNAESTECNQANTFISIGTVAFIGV